MSASRYVGQPVGLHDHAILVVAPQRRRLQPDGVVAPVDEALAVERAQRPVDVARVVQRALALPDVELHVEPLQRPADHPQRAFDGELLDRLIVGGRRGADPARAVAREEVAPETADVVAPVAVFGKRDLGQRRIDRARVLHVARPHRQRQHLDLIAGVVDVVLGRHRIAGEAQQARQRIADRGVPAVGDGDRAGRIGGQVLEDDVRRLARGAPPPVVARGEDGGQQALPERGRQAQVDEARPGDAGLRQRPSPARRQVRDDRLRHRARRLARRLRDRQRDVRREVAVLGALRALDRDVARDRGDDPLARQLAQRLDEQLAHGLTGARRRLHVDYLHVVSTHTCPASSCCQLSAPCAAEVTGSETARRCACSPRTSARARPWWWRSPQSPGRTD